MAKIRMTILIVKIQCRMVILENGPTGYSTTNMDLPYGHKVEGTATLKNSPTGCSTTNAYLSYGPAIQLLADFSKRSEKLYAHKGHSSVHGNLTYGSPNEDRLINAFHSARVALNYQHEQE